MAETLAESENLNISRYSNGRVHVYEIDPETGKKTHLSHNQVLEDRGYDSVDFQVGRELANQEEAPQEEVFYPQLSEEERVEMALELKAEIYQRVEEKRQRLMRAMEAGQPIAANTLADFEKRTREEVVMRQNLGPLETPGMLTLVTWPIQRLESMKPPKNEPTVTPRLGKNERNLAAYRERKGLDQEPEAPFREKTVKFLKIQVGRLREAYKKKEIGKKMLAVGSIGAVALIGVMEPDLDGPTVIGLGLGVGAGAGLLGMRKLKKAIDEVE